MMFGSWRRKRAQRGGEVEADLVLDLDLVDPGQVELHRVLGGHDVGVGLVERGDRGVERVGLARSGGARDQHDAVGLGDRALEALERVRLEAQLGHVQHELRLVEQPQHDLLAPEGGQRGDAEVHVAAAVLDLEADLDAAVLGQALLRDVQLGHDLDARGERVAAASWAAPSRCRGCRRCGSGRGTPSRRARCGCRRRPASGRRSAAR